MEMDASTQIHRFSLMYQQPPTVSGIWEQGQEQSQQGAMQHSDLTWSQTSSHFFSLSYWLSSFILSGGRFMELCGETGVRGTAVPRVPSGHRVLPIHSAPSACLLLGPWGHCRPQDVFMSPSGITDPSAMFHVQGCLGSPLQRAQELEDRRCSGELKSPLHVTRAQNSRPQPAWIQVQQHQHLAW